MAPVSTRVVLNRAAMSDLHRAWAEGVEEIVRTIIDVAKPNDAPPFGQGLVTRGGWLVYDGNKKVAGGSEQGTQPKKPRAAKTVPGMITGFAGYGFPARFHEMGTVNHGPHPFFVPAVEQVAAHAPAIMRSVVRRET
jgi:hypothetical protein